MVTDVAENEIELILSAQKGDQHAMEILLMRHKPLIFALSRRIFCETSEKESLIQAGYIGFIYAVRHYRSEMGTKLTTFAVSWILGEMKAALRREERSYMVDSLDHERADGMSELDTLTGNNGDNAKKMELKWALERLEEEARILISLRYFRDKTQKETAELLHRSQAQISRMERRAIDQLRVLLE